MHFRLTAPHRPVAFWPALSIPGAGALGWLVVQFDAAPVLVGLLALAAAAALVCRSEWATPAAVFLLYTNLPALGHQFHGMPRAAAAAFLLLFALPLVRALVVRRERLRIDAVLTWMLLYLVALLLSSLVARDQNIALARVGTYVAEGLLIYWLVLNTVRSTPALRKTVWSVLAAGSLLGGLTVYQAATRNYDQQFGGLAQRQLRFEEEQASRPRGEYRRADRAAGPLGDENRFAQVMIVLLPLATLMYRRSGSPALRLGAAAAGGAILAAVLLTYSRGAFVTLILLLLAYVALRWARPSRIMIGGAALAVVLLFAVPGYLQRISTIGSATQLVGDAPQEEPDATMRGRLTEMLAALHVFVDHPVLGVGPGQYAPFYSFEYQQNPDIKFRDIQKVRRAHTLYFEMAAEVGIFGLSFFLAAVGTLLRGLWQERIRWLRVRPLYADVATAFGLSVMVYLSTAVFLHLAYERYFWFLLAMAGASLQILRRTPEPQTLATTA